MSRVLSVVLLLHWAATFSLLAFLCVLAGDRGAAEAMNLLGVETASMVGSAPIATAVLSLAFAMSAVLFWWALVTLALNGADSRKDGDEVNQMAFASASATMLALLLFAVALGAERVFPVAAAHLAALLASFVAMHTGRQQSVAVTETQAPGHVAVYRSRAVEASQTATLVKFRPRSEASRFEGE